MFPDIEKSFFARDCALKNAVHSIKHSQCNRYAYSTVASVLAWLTWLLLGISIGAIIVTLPSISDF